MTSVIPRHIPALGWLQGSGEMDPMKPTAQEVDDGIPEAEVGTRGLCAFRLDGQIYFLVEEKATAGFLSADGCPGTTEVGFCEINGRTYIIIKPETAPATAHDLVQRLTERELEITTLVALGWPNKQIAVHLHISEWTVSTHLRRIFAKLGVHSRAAMVYRCTTLLGLGEQ